MARSHEYRVYLREILQNQEQAEEYLNAALEDGNFDVFLLALRNVVEARQTQSDHESLLEILSEQQNSEFKGIQKILETLGYDLAVKCHTTQNL